MSDEFRNRVREALEDRILRDNTTKRAISLAETGKPDLFRVLDDGRAKHPRVDTVRAISRALGVTEEWLLTGREPRRITDDAPKAPSAAIINPPPQVQRPTRRNRAEVADTHIDLPDIVSMPMNLPIYGTAAGSILQERVEGFMMFNGEAVDYIRRPPVLAHVKEAYALYVVGDSMLPAIRPGALQLVHPGRPPVPGDTVIVQTRHHDTDPGQAYIKVLVRRTAERVVLQQYNPPAEIEIPVKYVVSIHKVLTVNDLLGV